MRLECRFEFDKTRSLLKTIFSQDLNLVPALPRSVDFVVFACRGTAAEGARVAQALRQGGLGVDLMLEEVNKVSA